MTRSMIWLAVSVLALSGCESPSNSSDGNGTNAIGDSGSAPTVAPQPFLNDTGVTAYVDLYDYQAAGSFTTQNATPMVVETLSTEPTNAPDQDASLGRDNSANVTDSDGHVGFSFTKLDGNGQALADQTIPASPWDPMDPPWQCVKDNQTNLVWEVKISSLQELRGRDASFTWYNTDPDTNGGYEGTPNGGQCKSSVACDTQSYIEHMNNLNNGQGLCGYNDWRLPTMAELRSIMDYSVTPPADSTDPTLIDTTVNVLLIDGNYFPNTAPEDYWSSQTVIQAYDNTPGDRAWQLHFDSGETTTHSKAATSVHIRLVRGG